ncbi:DNA repair protein RAD16, partial [Lecanoromycetidae sp. Uapishka_2]
MDYDEGLLSTDEQTAMPPQQVLRKVVIPMTSRSSVGSSLSSARDQSSEYETPATSAVATPAESLVKGSISIMPTKWSGILTKGKRKRSQADELIETDALLAQSLQEQEYDDEESVVENNSKRARKATVEDSGDELSSLSDVLIESSIDVDDSEAPEAPQRRSRKAVQRMSLPSRVARDSARKAMNDKLSHQVIDSEDSGLSDHASDESVFPSGLDSDIFEDSEEGDEDHDVLDISHDVAGINTASATTTATPTGRRIRRALPARVRSSGRGRQSHWLVDRATRERQKLEKAHPEIKTMWDTLRNIPKIVPCQAAQPEGITRKLKSFQLEGLDWMTKQEQSQWKGGLLGDEMGMGKTIQAVSLIMSDYPTKEPTLVVVPPVALMQWQNEINEYTNGKLKVLVYHNSNSKVKNLTVKDLRGFDVIMISYSGLESTYRKESKGWKRDDGIVKENSKIHAIRFHRLMLDEAHNIKSRTTGGEDPELRRAALGKLRLVTDRIMLRRMKRDHTASMELPPKEVVIHNEFFGEIERDFSSSIMSNTTRKFDTYVSQGVMLNNYANIFGLIMQMRQVANHPDLILKKHAEGGQNVLVCSICDETAEEPIRSRCRHEFCRKCAKDYVRSLEVQVPDCPRCHIPLAIDFDQPDIEQDEDVVKKNSIINRIKMEDWTSSTKIEMLVYDLYKLRSQKQTHKSIVFSQFTSMLQLVEWRLRRAGFNTVMLDGSMSPAQRQKSIEYFMNNTHVEVFLVSLKAGGVALNLTEASRVFIIDPWWNPAAEWQSADRCHRIGQKRPCSITRLCIEDSVESRMVMLQEKKANMINGTINNDQVAMEKLTPEDMQFLFRGS